MQLYDAHPAARTIQYLAKYVEIFWTSVRGG